MTKKKNIASKLVLVLFVLTLISCCLLGSTFARYVSSGTGSASIGIAKWEIDISGNGVGTTEFELNTDGISPDITNAFDATKNRVQKTGKILVATIENKSDVAADVSVSSGAMTISLDSGKNYGVGINTDNWNTSNVAATQWQVEQVLQIKLYWDDSKTYTDTNGQECSGTRELAAATDGTGGGKIYIFAEVTWTSMDNFYQNENVADAIDTWIGENVTKISTNITYTAVQKSELPEATP